MARQFIVGEDDLREMLIALMRDTMCQRDGVDNWSWYGQSFNETIQDFYPTQLTVDEIEDKEIGFEECADAIIKNGKYEELTNMIKNISTLCDLHAALKAVY